MFRKILVPLDFTDKNKAALQIAMDLAKSSRSSITLLHVIERIPDVSVNELKDFYTRLEKIAADKMREMVEELPKRRRPIEELIVYGDRVDEIVAQAGETGTDLIVMSSHIMPRRGKTSRNWGTISYKVAILASCPVLLVK